MGNKPVRKREYVYFCVTSLIFLLLFNCATLKGVKEQEGPREHLIRGRTLLVQRDYEGALAENAEALALSDRQPPAVEALFNIGLIYAHFGNPKKDYAKALQSFVQIVNEYPTSSLVEEARVWVGMLHENQTFIHAIEESKQTIEESKQTIQESKQTIQETKQTITQLEKSKKPEPVTADRGEARAHLLRGQGLLAQGDYEGSLAENQKALAQSNRRPPGDEALFNIGLIYAHSGNPKKDNGKSLVFLKRMMEEFPKSPLFEQAKIWVGILQENERLNQIIKTSKEVDFEIEERRREKLK